MAHFQSLEYSRILILMFKHPSKMNVIRPVFQKQQTDMFATRYFNEVTVVLQHLTQQDHFARHLPYGEG